MIKNEKSFTHAGLADYWANGKSKKLPQDQLTRIRAVLVHLNSAHSIQDIATGLGKTKRFHQLRPHSDNRYSLDINGPMRITFKIVDDTTGEVDDIDYENTHD